MYAIVYAYSLMMHGIFQFACLFSLLLDFFYKYCLILVVLLFLGTYKWCLYLKVRASALVIPELMDLQDDLGEYLFAYSIRLSLEPQGCIINGMSFSSCQLHWRHWIIRANDIVISDVNGKAVIGQV